MGTRGKFLADMVRTSGDSAQFGLFRLPTWIDFNFNCGAGYVNCENKKVLQCKLCVDNKRLEDVAQHTCLLL